MEVLITERSDISPLLGMDWMKIFKLTIRRIPLAKNNQSEKEKIINNFLDLFENNKRIKDNEIKTQVKPGHFPVKQKARPVSLHIQKNVGRELEKVIKPGHLDKIKDLDEDCFVSPVVITVKSDKSVKIALDSRKLTVSCVKMRPHIPNMEELLNHISIEITRDRTMQLFISKIDLDYACGQIKLSEEISGQYVFALTGGKSAAIADSQKGFSDLSTYPQYFQKKLTGHSNTIPQLFKMI